MLYDQSAPKRPVNLSVNEDLVRMARKRGVNLSHVLENTLVSMLQVESRERFLEENRAGFAAYERFVEENGVFGDDYRTF